MKTLISKPLFWGTAAAVSLALHFWWLCTTLDVTNLARCGATWAVFAGALIARPIFRVGYSRWYQSTKIIDCGTFETTPEQLEEIRQSGIDAKCVQLYGPVLAVLGTALWAYGDLAANAIMRSLGSLIR